jgi:hypothetical protein
MVGANCYIQSENIASDTRHLFRKLQNAYLGARYSEEYHIDGQELSMLLTGINEQMIMLLKAVNPKLFGSD